MRDPYFTLKERKPRPILDQKPAAILSDKK